MGDQTVSLAPTPAGYASWLHELKTRIHAAQQRAALAVNRELVLLYWQIGRDILQRQAAQGWGAKVIDRLAHDLRTAFPGMKGFSRANLMYMRAFAQAWPAGEIVQQAVGQLPWGHLLLCKSKNKVVAEYALGDKSQPMGVAEYQLTDSLPAELQTSLPSIEQIESELGSFGQ